jgi:hypothetical protein
VGAELLSEPSVLGSQVGDDGAELAHEKAELAVDRSG